MGALLRVLAVACALPYTAGIVWDVGAELANQQDLEYDGNARNFIDPPFRILPYTSVAVMGRDGCPPADLKACGFVEVDVGLLMEADIAAAVIYTRGVEADLIAATAEVVEGGDATDHTACQLLNPAVANHSAVADAVASGRLLLLPGVPDATGHVELTGTYPLRHEDLWIASVIACTPAYVPTHLGDAVKRAPSGADAYIEFISPTGHLDATGYSSLLFHEINAFCLLVVLAAWLAFGVTRRSCWSPVHTVLTAMLVVVIIEHLVMWHYFSKYNATGEVSKGTLYVGVAVVALRKIAWCFLLAILVHGYRTVYPTLREVNWKAISVATAVYASICLLSFLEDPSEHDRRGSIIETAQSLADVLVYLWILTSLSTLIRRLDAQNQTTKKQLYNTLYRVLASFIVAYVVYIFFLIVLIAHGRAYIEGIWRGWWVFHAFFFVVFECILLAMMALWRPTEASARLLYAIELTNSGEDGADVPGPGGEEGMFDDLDMEGVVPARPQTAVIGVGESLAASPDTEA